MGYRLGVDLGTTFTAAATSNGASPAMLGLGNRAQQIPSVVYVQPDGSVLVGEAAERRGLTDPGRVVREFKRRIGDSVPILVAGAPYSPQALTARVLRWVVDRATERQGEPPEQVILTHPANWGGFKVDLLRQVAALADVTDLSLCSEPEAAALQYASHARVADGQAMAVYDLGGGTFDVCVLRKTGDGFRLVGNAEGIEHLGGIDFDEAVFRRILDSLNVDLSQADPDDADLHADLAQLRRDCVEAKEALSADVETEVRVTLSGRRTSVRLTRGEFEGLIRPALEETVGATRRALRSAGLSDTDLATFVLVGGSSRIPLVSELLYDAFRCPAALDTHPKHDIALGATRTGKLEATPTKRGQPRRPPADRRQLRAALTRAAGAIGLVLSTAGALLGLAGDSLGIGANANLLPQSDPLPVEQLIIPLAVDGNVDLYLVDTTTGTLGTRLTSGPEEDRRATISPDRRSIVYTRTTETASELRVIAANGSGDRPLFPDRPPDCDQMGTPTLNPANPQVLAVICGGSAGTDSLRVFRLDGTPLRQLDTGVSLTDPGFSPDGRTLVYATSDTVDSGQGALRLVAADGQRPPIVLTDGSAGLDAAPSWSPQGDRIAFQRRVETDTGLDANVLVVNPDGSGLNPLTAEGTQELFPTWSPDGAQIAFLSRRTRESRDANLRLWIMDADGGNPRQLLDDDEGSTSYAPGWGSR